MVCSLYNICIAPSYEKGITSVEKCCLSTSEFAQWCPKLHPNVFWHRPSGRASDRACEVIVKPGSGWTEFFYWGDALLLMGWYRYFKVNMPQCTGFECNLPVAFICFNKRIVFKYNALWQPFIVFELKMAIEEVLSCIWSPVFWERGSGLLVNLERSIGNGECPK